MTTYTTSGSVCGQCGHRHRTLRAAVKCADRHMNACNRHGGYSDRYVVSVDPAGGESPLSEAEHEDSLTITMRGINQ